MIIPVYSYLRIKNKFPFLKVYNFLSTVSHKLFPGLFTVQKVFYTLYTLWSPQTSCIPYNLCFLLLGLHSKGCYRSKTT